MGIDSNKRTSNIQKMRRHGSNGRHSVAPTRAQEALVAAESAASAGDILVQNSQPPKCEQCLANLQGRQYKKGHIASCPRSMYFGITPGEITAARQKKKKLKKPKMGFKTPQGLAKMFKDFTRAPVEAGDLNMSPSALCQLVDGSDITSATKAPPAIEILAHTFLKRMPTLDKATNLPPDTPANQKKMKWQKKTFGGGLSVTVQPQDPSKYPSAIYAAASGCRLHFLHWELLIPKLKCSRAFPRMTRFCLSFLCVKRLIGQFA